MNAYDRDLGMDTSITRRDFLNGVGLAVAGSLLAPELARAFEQEFAPERAPDLIITPLLGFDRAGRRIGYGAGHYDRAFQRFPGAHSAFDEHLPLHVAPSVASSTQR